MIEKARPVWVLLYFGLSVLIGLAILWYPAIAIILVISLVAMTCGLWWLPKLPDIFLGSLGILLVGYAFGGRSFAYLGIPPLFVGEIVLALGCLTLILYGGIQQVLKSPLSWFLIMFALWGAIRTVPYLQMYGIDALRDGVIWGYSIFGLLVAAFLLNRGYLFKVLILYQRWILLLLIWIPITLIVGKLTGGQNPIFAGLKVGDAAVHLAGVAGFLTLKLDQQDRDQNPAFSVLRGWCLWFLWVVGIVIVVSQSRSAFLAIVLPQFLLFSLKPSWQWGRVILGVVGLLLLSLVFNVSFDINDGRKISSAQIVSNVQSIFTDSSSQNDDLNGTKEWRLNWWDDILGYTVWGEFFWTGKGFGVNLAEDDGYIVETLSSSPLRSPHNGHLTILARAGVPGIVLWVILQVGFACLLIRAYFNANRLQHEQLGKINLWILVYWAAFMINGSFDVFLEGPQGGIWFWSLYGFGLAALITQNRKRLEISAMKVSCV